MNADYEKIKRLLGQLKNYSEETYYHSIDTANTALYIARKSNLDTKDIYKLYIAGLLHDIGKLKIDLDILHASRKLSNEEFEIMKTHSLFTRDILLKEGFPKDIVQIASRHHEKLNGSGYPFGLQEKDLSELDKILTVSDVTSALKSKRAYRSNLSNKEVASILNICVEKHELSEKYVKIAKEGLCDYNCKIIDELDTSIL